MRFLRAAFVCSLLLPLTLSIAASIAKAQVPPKQAVPPRATTPDEEKFFETSIRPMLAEKCYSCHSATEQRGGLRLDSREAMLKGNAHGPVLAPGDVEK